MSLFSKDKLFWWWDVNILAELGQYHDCWCPGSLCHRVISSHGIDYWINGFLTPDGLVFSLGFPWGIIPTTLQWCHNGHDSVSNHQPHDCLLNRLFRRRSKKTSKLRVTGLCAGNSPGTGEFPAQMASNAENVSIWWRHHKYMKHKSMG